MSPSRFTEQRPASAGRGSTSFPDELSASVRVALPA